ncbi:MAG: metal-sulfur cluster biosynthetic enzyme, partial [Halalkalicoccus sp.]|nr:metal-sulfur cluster biosynthetic enzyme [Halalkalicoccus sp.]
DADGDIESVRRELDEKARVARQYRAVSTLLEGGLTPPQIVELVHGDVETGEERATLRVDDTIRVCVDAAPIDR